MTNRAPLKYPYRAKNGCHWCDPRFNSSNHSRITARVLFDLGDLIHTDGGLIVRAEDLTETNVYLVDIRTEQEWANLPIDYLNHLIASGLNKQGDVYVLDNN